MRARQHAGRGGGGDENRQLSFGVKVNGGRTTTEVLVDDLSPR